MERFAWLILLWLFAAFASAGETNMPAVAFYYGANPPWDELRAFDWVVVEPGHVDDNAVTALNGPRLYAYVALGEIDPSRSYLSAVPASWRLGRNPSWNSEVIDQAQPDWPTFFVERVIAPLWQRGFRGFFLDTLDSYQIYSKDAEQRARQEAGMIATIRELKKRYPEAQLMFNRGFEILPQVYELVDAVAAESLFAGWNSAQRRYTDVAEADRQWLLENLQRVREWYRLPVIVIDYLPPRERARARETARRIDGMGFIPWVTNKELSMLGVGAVEVMPRRVLMIYDDAGDATELMVTTDAVRLGTAPANYLGYAVDYLDARQPLPKEPLTGRVAGIVVWLGQALAPSAVPKLSAWIERQVGDGVPLLLLGNLQFLLNNDAAARLGLRTKPLERMPEHITIEAASALFGFETKPRVERTGFFPLAVDNGESQLTLRDESGNSQVAAALMPWGAYVLAPFVAVTLPDGQGERWVVNPFVLLQKALRLAPMPVPDTTTENGRRLLLIHMDGDGFPSHSELPGHNFAGEVLRDRILKKYRLPVTVSVIEGEVGSAGLYPQLAPRLEAIARSIFALPYVEIGSHSYSHPFNWVKAAKADSEGNTLPIPGYTFDLRREIAGSIEYINNRLAPPNKRVKLFQWSGNCNPNGEAVALTEQLGVLNINGGETVITDSRRTLTAVAPLGLPKEGHFQVFAPNQNENVYTNNWRGPFYGYRRVIETFELTDAPRRIKPINIYFHTFAATKLASLDALDEVFKWAGSQHPMPIYISEYARKVLDFEHVVVARDHDRWRVRGLGALRELRIPRTLGIPDLASSIGIAGYDEYGDDLYVHAAAGDVELALAERPPDEPYLVSANGHLNEYARSEHETRFQFTAYVPLKFTLRNADNCSVSVARKNYPPHRDGVTATYTINDHVTEPIEARCGR